MTLHGFDAFSAQEQPGNLANMVTVAIAQAVFVNLEDVERRFLLFRVDADSTNAVLGAGAKDPKGDPAAAGDQHTVRTVER